MPTVNDVLRIAKKEVGVKESPPNSNRVKYNTWYYGSPVVGIAYPWCVTFVQWVYWKAKVSLPIKTASCGQLMRAAVDQKMIVYKGFRPGDIVLYNWEGKTAPTHCGIYFEPITKSEFRAIEGNTSLTSNDNGGSVMIRTRKVKNVVAAVRPRFYEDVSDMTVSEFIKTATDKECYELLKKAMRHMYTLPEPNWSKKNGAWEKLCQLNIFSNENPEGLVKRDELATVIMRLKSLFNGQK